jgi:hypothetical protein
LYTTNGSNPKNDGADYVVPFIVPRGARLLQVVADSSTIGICSDILSVEIPDQLDVKQELNINKLKELTLNRKISATNAVETYALLDLYKNHNAMYSEVKLGLQERGNDNNFVELLCGGKDVTCSSESILAVIRDFKVKLMNDVDIDIQIEAKKSIFKTGQDFEDWVTERKEELNDYFEKVQQ